MKIKAIASLAFLLSCTPSFADEAAERWDLLEGIELDTEAKPPKAFFEGKEITLCEAAARFTDITITRGEAFQDAIAESLVSSAHAARVMADRWESVEILSALCLRRKPYAWRLTPRMREQLRSLRAS